METRKVQLSGGTTFTVSLPKSWATEQDISGGSVLYLHPDDDGTLLVEAGTDQDGEERSATLDVTTYNDAMVAEAVKSMYLVGLDRITLVDRDGHDDDRVRTATELTTELTGLEVLETTDRRLVFQNLVDCTTVSIRKSVLRLKLIALAMHRDAVDSVIKNDLTLAQQVVTRDAEADKLFCLVTRQFQCALENLQTVEQLGISRVELFEYYYIARQLERIGDHAAKIAGHVTERNEGLPEVDTEEFATLATDASRIVERASDAALSDVDAATAFGAIDDAAGLNDRIAEVDRELYERDDVTGAYVVGLLLDSVRRITSYGRNIADMGVQQQVRDSEIA